jgi:hypothetical protein
MNVVCVVTARDPADIFGQQRVPSMCSIFCLLGIGAKLFLLRLWVVDIVTYF